MKSLKQRILLLVGILLVVICVCLSVTSFMNASSLLQHSTQNSIKEVARQTSATVSGLLKGNLKELEAMASRSDIKDANLSKEDKIVVLYDEAQRMGCERTTIIDMNGDSFNGNGKEQNLGDREYFQRAIKGESNFTDPIIGKSTGQLLVFYATPIKEGDQIVGVLQEV